MQSDGSSIVSSGGDNSNMRQQTSGNTTAHEANKAGQWRQCHGSAQCITCNRIALPTWVTEPGEIKMFQKLA